MAVNVSRLRAAGLVKESVLGTIIATPTRYLNIIPPDGFTPMIDPLPSKGIQSLRDMYPKITAGPAHLNGMKIKLEVEPENIGEILQALFGSDVKTGPADTTAYTHTFTPQQVSVLPTYSWWFDKSSLKYPLFGGCMLDSCDFSVKAKGIVEADMSWVGIKYDDATGSSKSTVFSTIPPFVFQNAVINVDGAPVNGYDNLKISIKNMVKADHSLSNSQYPYTIYSEGLDVELSAELFFESTTQYAKFLAGTTAHFQLVLTSGVKVAGSAATFYSLTLDVPLVYYKSANLFIPSNGPLKIPFVGHAQYSFAGSVYTIQAILVNGVSTTY
jgi:hypothetical protein